LLKKGDAYERFIVSLDEMDQLLKEHNIKIALNFSDKKKHANKAEQLLSSRLKALIL